MTDDVFDYIELNASSCTGRAVALGFFDGIHLGHRLIIQKTVEAARSRGLKATVLTFSDFPVKGFKALTSLDEKIEIIKELGADEVICAKFTDELKNMSPEEFFEKVLCDRFGSEVLVSGGDYTFGRMASGNTELLSALASSKAVTHIIVPDVLYAGEKSSSTKIRDLLKNGGASEAVELLGGRPFCYEGVVVYGKKLGRTLGFPTVNIPVPEDKLIAKFGVYRSRVIIDGKAYPSVSNVGLRPTVEHSDNINCETFIYNFDKDMYGRFIRVELWEFIRPEMAFSSVDQLKAQVDSDKEKVANLWEINIIV